jgi:hypothetical protein
VIKLKICKTCKESKNEKEDFYFSCGHPRGECKTCVIKKNGEHQKKKPWQDRYSSPEERKLYMRDYYRNNKEKFSKYRAEFKEKYPDYYREYFKNNKKRGHEISHAPKSTTFIYQQKASGDSC